MPLKKLKEQPIGILRSKIDKKYIKIRLHLTPKWLKMFFYTKNKEKKKPNEIDFLKNYFVTAS